MVPKQITKSDLDNLEIRITKESKDDIVTAKKERHKMVEDVQKSFVMIDDVKDEVRELDKKVVGIEQLLINTPKAKCMKETEIAVIQNNHQTMSNRLTGIEQGIEKIFNKIDTFVTKTDHKEAHEENKARIARIEWGILILLTSLAAYLFTLAGSHIFK